MSKGPDLRNVHPDYALMQRRWLMAHDFYRGGKWVLEPEHPSTFYYAASRIASSGSTPTPSSPAREGLSAEWFRADSNSYLWKHSSESSEEYEERCARAVHIPVYSRVIDIYAAGILRTPANRSAADLPVWSDYHKDVDLSGTSYEQFIRETLNTALEFGRVHALTDMSQVGDGQPVVTREEQRKQGIRAYTYLVSPLQLVDWSLDDRGRFVWVVIAESAPDARAPGSQPPKQVRARYRVWTQSTWEVWEEPAGKKRAAPILTSAGEHGLGEVPIATLYTSRGKVMACESPFADVLDGDRRLFNKYSELDTLERYCGFPVLGIPEAGDKAAGPLGWGPARAFTYDGTAGGAPTWLSPDPTHARDGWKRLLEQIFAYRFTSGATRTQEQSLEERGAAAISAESEDKRNMMAAWAAAVEEFDTVTHRHVAKWEKIDAPPPACYPRNFDLRAIAAQVNDLVQLASTNHVSSEALAALIRPVVAKILAEHGRPKDEIEKVVASIDGESTAPAPQPAPQPAPDSPFAGAMARADGAP